MYNYSYSYNYNGLGAAVGFLIVFYIIMLAVCVIMIAANWKLFTKAGIEGWKAIIPFYNTYIMTELSGMNIVWFILTFVPCANFVASIMITLEFLKSYDVPSGMRVAAIFFPFIVYPMVAFSSKYQYIGID